jgi:hypothetical protein
MKHILILAAVLTCSVAFADSVTVLITSTGAATYSSPINASGWLDRIEIVKSSDTGTCDIVVGTFSGTTALEKFVNISALAEGTDSVVLRPRAVGTLITAATALTAAGTVYVGEITNAVAGTVLTAPYERMMLGGNLKLYASSQTNAVITATIYFEPTKK